MVAKPATAPADAPELLERAGELRTLTSAFDVAVHVRRGRFVLVSGEAGLGKTTLLRYFCDQHLNGAPIFWGACDPLFTPRPLGALLDIAESVGGDFAEYLAEGRELHELVGALVRTLATHRPAVVVFEDVHWADEATLDVLRVLSRKVEDVAALVLLARTATTSSSGVIRCGERSASSPRSAPSAA